MARYDDPAFEVVSILFRVLASKKVTTPGSFQSHEGQSAVKCNVKANEGQLYFLEKQFLFISKQPTLVLHSDISAVTFARFVVPVVLPFIARADLAVARSVGGALPSARTFDLNVRLKGDSDHPIIFSALNKEELTTIEEHLRAKKIRVKNEMDELAAAEVAALGDDDDDDDDDDMDVDKAAVKDLLGEEDDEDSEGALALSGARVPAPDTDSARSLVSFTSQSTRTSRPSLNRTAAVEGAATRTRTRTPGATSPRRKRPRPTSEQAWTRAYSCEPLQDYCTAARRAVGVEPPLVVSLLTKLRYVPHDFDRNQQTDNLQHAVNTPAAITRLRRPRRRRDPTWTRAAGSPPPRRGPHSTAAPAPQHRARVVRMHAEGPCPSDHGSRASPARR